MIKIPYRRIEKHIRSGAAPGCSITVVTSKGESESVSFGSYDGKGHEDVTCQSVYDLASITKLYTTALILRLVKKKRLSLNTPCFTFFDNFANSNITILDLLTHRVNFDLRLSEFRERFSTSVTLGTALRKIRPPNSPSNLIHYANLGFIYLGMIIEKIEEKSLNDVFGELFNQLELEQTFTGTDVIMLDVDAPPTEIIGDITIQNETHDETARQLGGIAGNAGVFSSSHDLAKFGKYWLEINFFMDRILMQAVFHDYDVSGHKPQALGWWKRIPFSDGDLNTPAIYSHTGFTGSLLMIKPDIKTVCAITTNRTYYGRDNIKHKDVWKLLANSL